MATKKYANYIGYSDIYPYEIIEQVTEKKLAIRRMKCELLKKPVCLGVGGFMAVFDNSTQSWKIEPDETAETEFIRLHKDGKWKNVNGSVFQLTDAPVKRYDYNF